jgi:hypothetical protein
VKIGLSYSRCVRDIVDGVVDISDVLIVIARTNFNPLVDEEWSDIWHGYHSRSGWSNPEWGNYTDEDEDRFRSVSIELWESGRLHQPRKFGARAVRRSEIWLETVLVDEDLENRPAVKAAWDQFQMLAGLTNTTMDKDYG